MKPFSAQEPVRHQRLTRDLNRKYYLWRAFHCFHAIDKKLRFVWQGDPGTFLPCTASDEEISTSAAISEGEAQPRLERTAGLTERRAKRFEACTYLVFISDVTDTRSLFGPIEKVR